jgi:hypothetical protein
MGGNGVYVNYTITLPGAAPAHYQAGPYPDIEADYQRWDIAGYAHVSNCYVTPLRDDKRLSTTRRAPSYDWRRCDACGGSGEVQTANPQHDDPYFCTVRMCRDCNGSGWVA